MSRDYDHGNQYPRTSHCHRFLRVGQYQLPLHISYIDEKLCIYSSMLFHCIYMQLQYCIVIVLQQRSMLSFEIQYFKLASGYWNRCYDMARPYRPTASHTVSYSYQYDALSQNVNISCFFRKWRLRKFLLTSDSRKHEAVRKLVTTGNNSDSVSLTTERVSDLGRVLDQRILEGRRLHDQLVIINTCTRMQQHAASALLVRSPTVYLPALTAFA
jgi:hypothetical protein